MKKIERQVYLNKLISYKDKSLIKVITGIRRCGKSTIMEIYRDWLKDSGVLPEQIVYLNFEDYDYYELRDPKKLYDYVRQKIQQDKMTYLFFDEIQVVPQWEKLINSYFAKENYESRHNLTYWNNDNYYGFGAGASGFIDNIRYDNTKSVFKYNYGKTGVYEEKLSLNELMKDEVMLSLRKINGINKDVFYKKYNILLEDAFDYKSLIRNNFLTETSKNLYINENELFVSNEIIIMFLNSYLLEQKR